MQGAVGDQGEHHEADAATDQAAHDEVEAAQLDGPGDDGELTIGEWADLTDSIPEEVSCRIGARVPRHYLGRTGGGVDSGATATAAAPDGTAAGASS